MSNIRMFLRSKYAETDRIYFLSWEEGNYSDAIHLWGDDQVTRLIGGPFSEEKIQERFQRERETFMRFQVQYWPFYRKFTLNEEEKSNKRELIGCCGLRPYGETGEMYELGFHLLPKFWGNGFAKEAAQSVIEFSFKILKAKALFAGHNPFNLASKRLLEKLGFKFSHEEFYPPTGLNHPSYLLNNPYLET